jgi:hypothetical protein
LGEGREAKLEVLSGAAGAAATGVITDPLRALPRTLLFPPQKDVAAPPPGWNLPGNFALSQIWRFRVTDKVTS